MESIKQMNWVKGVLRKKKISSQNVANRLIALLAFGWYFAGKFAYFKKKFKKKEKNIFRNRKKFETEFA